MVTRIALVGLLFLGSASLGQSFQPASHASFSIGQTAPRVAPLRLFGNSQGPSSIPSSPSNRDKQAIESIKAAINKPKTPGFPLIECEFPPLDNLNKLGDGSLRSAKLVDDANLAFCASLVRGLAPLPFGGPSVKILTSTAATSGFLSSLSQKVKGVSMASVRDLASQEFSSADICVLPSPSSRQDYLAAQQLASSGVVAAVVLINGLAKDQKSVKGDATMAYYLKPLTYNSQVVGYLARKYPSDWAAIDIASKEVLGSYSDSEILFQKTNTPDLRGPGRLVQKSVDDRAIRARKEAGNF